MAGKKYPKNHFRIEVEGKIFAFAYIRKCACSSLKGLVSAVYPDVKDFFEFMNANRFMPDKDEVDYSIFFYRDAVERVTSCVINKFIVRNGADDIIRRVEDVLEKSIDDACFADICFQYLPLVSKAPELVDPHFWSINQQLMPMRYTHAVELSDIYTLMEELIGERMAGKIFRDPANQTKTNGALRFDAQHDNSRVSFGELRSIFPGYQVGSFKESLVSQEIRECIQLIYSRDQDLVRLIESSQLLKHDTEAPGKIH